MIEAAIGGQEVTGKCRMSPRLRKVVTWVLLYIDMLHSS